MCGKPGKGVLHDDDPHFSELFEVLKNASACRKGFFDTLTGRKRLTSGLWAYQKSESLSSTGRKGVCGKPGKGVLHDDDPHFSELFEVLKNASACRKGFFDTLTGRKRLTSGLWAYQKSESLSSTGRKGVCGKPGKGVLHDDDPHFSELFEVLKNASACRKDYFDTLTGRKHFELHPIC